MKVTIIDMNNIEVFVSLEDGRILSFPANTIENPQIGDTLEFPKSDYLVVVINIIILTYL